jgi:hypothetical protein
MSIAIDAHAIYWAESKIDADRVNKVAKAGGAIVTVAPLGGGSYGLVVDDGQVYWTVYDNEAPVFAVSKNGGPVSTLVDGQRRATYLAQDDTHLYWLNTGTLGSHYVDGSVMRVEKSGGMPSALATNRTMLIDIEVSGDWVVFTDLSGLYQLPKTGGPISDIARGEILGFALDEASIYWSQGSEVLRRSLEPGGAREVLVTRTAPPRPVVVDESCVYASTAPGGPLERFPKNGGRVVTLVDGTFGMDFAADDARVYWTEYEQGRIMSATK